MNLSPSMLQRTPIRLGVVFLLLSCVFCVSLKAEQGQLVRPGGLSIEQNKPGAPIHGAVAQATSASNANALDIPLSQGSGSPAESVQKRSVNFGLGNSLGTTIGALVVTLGLFTILVLVMKRVQTNPKQMGLPREAFEVIGETTIGPKQKLMVVRCGVQALVVGVSPAGIQSVAQIDDPDEAGQFIAQCRGLGSTAEFNKTLREMEKEPVQRGFVANEPSRQTSGKLFLRA
jgi:flagellar biogenesis protein FliO